MIQSREEIERARSALLVRLVAVGLGFVAVIVAAYRIGGPDWALLASGLLLWRGAGGLR